MQWSVQNVKDTFKEALEQSVYLKPRQINYGLIFEINDDKNTYLYVYLLNILFDKSNLYMLSKQQHFLFSSYVYSYLCQNPEHFLKIQ